MREQIRQLTQVHGVPRKQLPLSKQTGRRRQKLGFKELFENLKKLLGRGDPITLPAPPLSPPNIANAVGRPSKVHPRTSAEEKVEDGDWIAVERD